MQLLMLQTKEEDSEFDNATKTVNSITHTNSDKGL